MQRFFGTILDTMRKQTALLLSIILTLCYMSYLLISSHFFMPSEGYRVQTRQVAQSLLLQGRDDSNSRSLLPGETVSINAADQDTLMRLPGIGPSLSAAIVEDREKNGPFQNPEDLLRVPGIGKKRLDAIMPFITIGGED